MSSANLDLVRSIFASIGRGDYRSADWADPEIKRVVVEGPDPDSVSGPLGLANEMRNLFSAFEDLHKEAEEYREVDNERVLIVYFNRERAFADLGHAPESGT